MWLTPHTTNVCLLIPHRTNVCRQSILLQLYVMELQSELEVVQFTDTYIPKDIFYVAIIVSELQFYAAEDI